MNFDKAVDKGLSIFARIFAFVVMGYALVRIMIHGDIVAEEYLQKVSATLLFFSSVLFWLVIENINKISKLEKQIKEGE